MVRKWADWDEGKERDDDPRDRARWNEFASEVSASDQHSFGDDRWVVLKRWLKRIFRA